VLDGFPIKKNDTSLLVNAGFNPQVIVELVAPQNSKSFSFEYEHSIAG
jgi:hypothetical protein